MFEFLDSGSEAFRGFSISRARANLIIRPYRLNAVIPLFKSHLIGMLFLAILALSFTATADQYAINISENKFLGNYLVNQSGFALYYTTGDEQGKGASTCYDECAALWPPFYAPNLTLPETLRSVEFGTITRTDGSKQTTFKSWPLYLYSRDTGAGDTFGNGVKGLWHVIDPSNQPQMI